MPTYSYFCRSCDEPYELSMSTREKEAWNARCPKCGAEEGKQELYSVSPDGGGCASGGCCGSGGNGCCG